MSLSVINTKKLKFNVIGKQIYDATQEYQSLGKKKMG